jgi:hypothetical protein
LIYTDNDSSAEVTFNEGGTLEIGENSLVKLRSSGSEQGMDLAKGFIRAKLEGGKPLKVQMNGEDYLVSGKDADIQINLQNSKGEIGVLSGEIKIEGAGVSENLNTQSALEISGDDVKKHAIYFKSLSPLQGETNYILNPPGQISFTWEPVEPAKVLISHKASLEEPQIFQGDSGLIASLEPGLYYYKIVGSQGTSLVSSFKIIQENAPKILRPRNGETVSVIEGTNPKILLQWKGNERVDHLLEWESGETKSLSVSGASALVNVNPGTPFKWRVKIQDDKRPDAVWSDWQEVTVSMVPMPVMPTELLPHNVDYQTYEKPNEKIEFSWKNQAKVELEIKVPNGEMKSYKVDGNTFEYYATTGGNYTWRARGIDSYLRVSEWTERKTFSLEDLSDQMNDENIQRVQLKKPDQSVTFSWQATDGTTSVFELSKDANFKQVVKKVEVTKDSTQVNVPEVGTYYWRSRQFRPDGTFNVSEPKRIIIEPVPAPLKPDKLPDWEVPLEELPVKSTYTENVLNFILSSAYADELKGIVHIELPVTEESKGYIVRIYKDPELQELVFQEQITTKSFEWPDAKAGVYYWQYAVIDYWDRQSLFSDVSQLTVKADPTPLPVRPKLLSPIRAMEVDQKELVLGWSEAVENSEYQVEVSDRENFEKIISSQVSKKPQASFTVVKLKPGLHYWRVHAFNKKKKEVVSNTGRFTILPPVEKTIIADFPPVYVKEWKTRGFVAWAPSMDSYTFSDGETGTIDGTAMMSGLISGTMFKEDYTFNGELLRQTGQVFEGESYLFQRLLIDGIKTWKKNHHRYGLGLAVGQSSGQAYEFDSTLAVTAKEVSGLSYGPAFRNYYVFNELWEMQGKFFYLLSGIKQMELGADAIRRYKNYLLIGGLGYSSREYEISSGKQTSMKVTLGFGKEF